MKKILIVTGISAVLLIVAYLQFKSGSADADPRGGAYAGSKSCIKCHAGIYNSFLHTAHYIASIPATENTVHGDFTNGFNVLKVSDAQKIVMEKSDSGLFQAYYLNGKLVERHRFDIVFGGVKGETYLYWKGNSLYQLFGSYYSKQGEWLVSPRFAPGQVNFNRAIAKRCLECHASYVADQTDAVKQLNSAEQFDKSSLVYSVDCERCHGPGAQHADFHIKNPQVKTARFIVKYASLTRAQKIDMCGVCHSGNKSEMLRSTFAFRPGDTLAKFKLPDLYNAVLNPGSLDVHGNQCQLLETSKCFINSKMDCATCHDTHQNTRGNDVLYTRKCLGCHNSPGHSFCKMTSQLSTTALKANCINCHMPALQTNAIAVLGVRKQSPMQFFVRTHHIAIYPQEVKKIMAFINH